MDEALYIIALCPGLSLDQLRMRLESDWPIFQCVSRGLVSMKNDRYYISHAGRKRVDEGLVEDIRAMYGADIFEAWHSERISEQIKEETDENE